MRGDEVGDVCNLRIKKVGVIITDGYRASLYRSIYGVWSMVGIEAGCGLGCGLGWSMEVQGISNPDCNTLLRQNPARLNPEEPCPMTVPTPHPGLRGLSFGTISYASLSVITRMTRWRRKQPVNRPKKPLHQDTDNWLHLLREIRYRSSSVRHGELSSP